jgi:F-type H+-transporting ATPase subunit b
MDDRGREIEGGLESAKSNAELLEKTKREYESVLAKARTEANDIFERGKKEAEQKKSAMLEEAKAEVADMIAAGKKSLEMEKSKMVEDAKRDIISLVISSTEKVAGKVDAAHADAIKRELSVL